MLWILFIVVVIVGKDFGFMILYVELFGWWV